jgi:transposase
MDLSKLHLHWRVSQYKGRSYRSYSLARAYREKGKNKKEVVVKLGKLSDDEASRWRVFLKAIKNPKAVLATLDDIFVNSHYDYLDIAVANAVWDEWGLAKIFPENDRRSIKIETIARILAINRCIDPAAKSKTPEWFNSTALPWMLNVDQDKINPSRIFRELAVIEENKENICKHLFERMMLKNRDSMRSVFYDLSSTTFTGSQCVLMKWGHCKEGYHNHIVLALVVNRDGFPFYWEVLPGGTADSKTIAWLLEKVQDRFKIKGITLVFDRGMVSDDNLNVIESSKIKYISAMDRSQLETITDVDFFLFSHLEPGKIDEQIISLSDFEFKQLNDSTYYREIKVIGKRRYILCFNPVLFKDQRKSRDRAVADFRIFAENLNEELGNAKKSRQRKATYKKFKDQLIKAKINSFVDVKLHTYHVRKKHAKNPIRTYKADVIVNADMMVENGRFDGFWLLVTNHTFAINGEFEMPPEDLINPYREKTIIESAFRDIKSFIDMSPVFVWTESHVKAHYSCCVLAHLINRTITFRLHENKGKTTNHIVSHERFYNELSDCKIDHIEIKDTGLSVYNMTASTEEQEELLMRVGLSDLLSFAVKEGGTAPKSKNYV